MQISTQVVLWLKENQTAQDGFETLVHIINSGLSDTGFSLEYYTRPVEAAGRINIILDKKRQSVKKLIIDLIKEEPNPNYLEDEILDETTDAIMKAVS